MRIRNLLFLILALGGLAALFTPAAAQSCWWCDDSSWTQGAECAPQGWTGYGHTQCEINDQNPNECDMGGGVCWGPDPEDADMAAAMLRADGTLLAAPIAVASVTTRAESLGLSAEARLHERTCKGLVTRRLYGAHARAELLRTTERLVI